MIGHTFMIELVLKPFFFSTDLNLLQEHTATHSRRQTDTHTHTHMHTHTHTHTHTLTHTHTCTHIHTHAHTHMHTHTHTHSQLYINIHWSVGYWHLCSILCTPQGRLLFCLFFLLFSVPHNFDEIKPSIVLYYSQYRTR